MGFPGNQTKLGEMKRKNLQPSCKNSIARVSSKILFCFLLSLTFLSNQTLRSGRTRNPPFLIINSNPEDTDEKIKTQFKLNAICNNQNNPQNFILFSSPAFAISSWSYRTKNPYMFYNNSSSCKHSETKKKNSIHTPHEMSEQE